MSDNSLNKKRRAALLKIAFTASSTFAASLSPTSALETVKQISLSVVDALMCYEIYKIYFDDEPSVQNLSNMLGASGIILVGGGLASHTVLRISQSFLDEVLNCAPPLMILSGVLSGSGSVTIGLAWMYYLEKKYSATSPIGFTG